MRSDRLLHFGTGLLALSLLLALGLANLRLEPDPGDLLALALAGWIQSVSLVTGAGMLVGHLVVGALTPPSLEEQIADWYEEP
jgi:hypothetical protein